MKHEGVSETHYVGGKRSATAQEERGREPWPCKETVGSENKYDGHLLMVIHSFLGFPRVKNISFWCTVKKVLVSYRKNHNYKRLNLIHMRCVKLKQGLGLFSHTIMDSRRIAIGLRA